MNITFYGAVQGVTGSCTLVETQNLRILIDCGMYQSGHGSFQKNAAPFPFDPKTIDVVIMTHGHTDHIGRIPKLVNEGFSGRIFSTHPTRLIARLMWQDAAHVLKDDARRNNLKPFFAPKDIPKVFNLTHGTTYDTTVSVDGRVSFVLREAGHIFGSSFCEMDIEGKRLVFSGDLGNDFVPILRPTAAITHADFLVMESTYGDRVHESTEKRMERLLVAVRETAAQKGVLLIPAFSLERAQEMLYELHLLEEQKKIPSLPTYLDSPLAIKVLPIYKKFSEYYDREAAALKASGDDFFKFPGLHMTEAPEDSRHIIDVAPPKIIIAGSGMMHGGRIMGHLAHYLSDPKTTVLVIGYQSAGTVGRSVSEGVKVVHIDHQAIEVRARVEVIGAYSAHADQSKLLRWVKSGSTVPQRVFLNHGEPAASQALADLIVAQDHFAVTIPQVGESFLL